MLMKKLGRYLGAIGLLLLIGVATSCIKDDIATTETGTANITVNISSRSGEVDNDNSEVLANEDIKTIRLILVQNGKVVSNLKHSFTASDGQKLLEQGIRIVGVKKAATDFYAVVNEESTGESFDTGFAVGAPFSAQAFMQTVLPASDATFPKSDIREKGLPMQGKASISESALVDNVSVVIPVECVVARIDLNLVNNTGSLLDINKINFGAFFPSQTQLGEFAPGTYAPKPFAETVSIPATAGNNTHKFTYYLYESKAGAGQYTVSLNDGTEYGAVPILVDGEQVTELLRNHILSITGTINSSGWELTCEVNPWEKEDIDLSFEDNLSYSEGKWTQDTYLEILDNNIVHLSPDKTAELTFTIQTPSGAKWRASLEGDINAFEFEGPNEGIAGIEDENGHVPVQTIKLKVKDPEFQGRYEAQLHVFAYIGSKGYELDLTEGSNTSTGPVNYFTILQAQ